MKKALTIGVVGVALAATLPFVFAGAKIDTVVTEADAVPAVEIVAAVRSMRLKPIGEPVRHGPYYMMNAVDPRGVPVRVVADARFGDILSVAPAQPVNTAPGYQGGAHIIQVPQAGDRDQPDERADRDSGDSRDDIDVQDDDVAPPPPRRPPYRAVAPAPRMEAKPKPRTVRQIDMTPKSRAPAPVLPQPPSPRRAVLSAPPPAAEGPTPIRPTPKFDGKSGARADADQSPRLPELNADTPPPGYVPPAVAPHDE